MRFSGHPKPKCDHLLALPQRQMFFLINEQLLNDRIFHLVCGYLMQVDFQHESIGLPRPVAPNPNLARWMFRPKVERHQTAGVLVPANHVAQRRHVGFLGNIDPKTAAFLPIEEGFYHGIQPVQVKQVEQHLALALAGRFAEFAVIVVANTVVQFRIPVGMPPAQVGAKGFPCNIVRINTFLSD